MNYKRRRIATLDLGSNSFLLLIAERSEEGILRILRDESATPRLGEGARESRWISAAALERAVAALREFAERARADGAEEIFATATSAVREASNREEVVRTLTEAAGVPIEVIDASEEARLSYLSVTMERPHHERVMVADIGGGSTELSWGIGPRFDGGRSLDLGTVKILESHLRDECPSEGALDAARNEIDNRLARLTPLGALDHYYGTAGSFTHLAALDLAMDPYLPERLAGHKLTRPAVTEWVRRIARMPLAERARLKGADPRRVDVLLSGTLIIERLQAKFGIPAFEVFDRGIRFGKLFDLLRGFLPPIIR